MFFRLMEKLFKRPNKSGRPHWGQRALLSCESLEDRWVPAAQNLSGGVLTIDFGVGDDGDIVTIRQDADDEYTVFDTGTTAVNTFTGVDSIVVNGNGIDSITLRLDGDDDSSDSLAGNFSFTQTGGDAVVIEDANSGGTAASGFGVTGTFTVNNASSDLLMVELDDGNHAFGNTTINDGGAVASVELGDDSFGMTINGFVSLDLGEGDSIATIEDSGVNGFVSFIGESGNDDANVLNSEVFGDAAFELGEGDNSVTINPSDIVGDVFGGVNLATGAFTDAEFDEIIIDGARIGGVVSFSNNGDGDLFVDVSDASGQLEILGFTSFLSGDGNDTIVFDGLGVATFELFDNAGVNLGGGTNIFDVTEINAFLNLFAHASTGLGPDGRTPVPDFAASGGLDFFLLDGSTVSGFVSVVNNGTTGLDADVIGSSIGEFFSVISGDTADDVSVDDSTIAGGFDVAGIFNAAGYDLGDGDDTVSHDNSILLGRVFMDTGAGDDSVLLAGDVADGDTSYLGDQNIFEALGIEMGAGDDTLTFGIDADNLAILFADADVDGGAGTNELDADDTIGFNGAVVNAANFT